jgi:hypothetical protein
MKSLHIVEEEVSGEATAGLEDCLVVMEIDLLIFDGPPETLDKDIIVYPATTVHADTDILLLQPTGKLSACKLAALIGIEDLGLRCLQGLVQG